MSGTRTVRLFDGTARQWNDFVAQAGGSTFHEREIGDVLESVYGHEQLYLAAYDEGRLAGVLPLVRVHSRVFGEHVVSLPYFSYGGPLGDAASEQALADAAIALSGNAKLLELRSRQPVATRMRVSNRKLTVVLPIVPGDYEATFKRFDSKLRSQVRRADKEGVVVKFGDECLADFQAVYDEHMRDLGSPAHGADFFSRLLAALGSRMWVGVAYLGDVAVAGGIAIENRNEVEITWASSLRRYSKLSPNMALYGAFIRRSCEQQFSDFNFGRCTAGSNTHRFKLQWGAMDEALAWQQYSARNIVSPPSADSAHFQLAARLWQRLPVSITKRIGPLVMAGIP